MKIDNEITIKLKVSEIRLLENILDYFVGNAIEKTWRQEIEFAKLIEEEMIK